jgi:hypothetical protein
MPRNASIEEMPRRVKMEAGLMSVPLQRRAMNAWLQRLMGLGWNSRHWTLLLKINGGEIMTNIICNYDKIKLLGGNINGSMSTWLAKDEQAVIKEFNFGSGDFWRK